MIKKIVDGKLGRRKSPTISPGTHCPIPKDKTFKNVTLVNASLTGRLIQIPEFGLEAKVVFSKEIIDGHYACQLVISETVINLKLQDCMTWYIPQSEKPKLELLRPKLATKPKSKH